MYTRYIYEENTRTSLPTSVPLDIDPQELMDTCVLCAIYHMIYIPTHVKRSCTATAVLFLILRTNCCSFFFFYHHPYTRAQTLATGSAAARIHAAQIVLSIAQAVVALIVGMLSARPRGMLCGALVLHSVGWPAAWLMSGVALKRTPRSSKALLWFWCCALVLNRWETWRFFV